MNSRILDYFNNNASLYMIRSSKGLWQYLRNLEVRAVKKLLKHCNIQHVLDLGCGTGYYSQLMLELGSSKVMCLDWSKQMVNQLPGDSRIQRMHANAETQSFKQEYSLVICAGVLEFVSDPPAVLKNAKSAIDPNGHILLLVPRRSIGALFYYIFHRFNGFSINIFSRKKLDDLICSLNLKMVEAVTVFPFTKVCILKKTDG